MVSSSLNDSRIVIRIFHNDFMVVLWIEGLDFHVW